MLENKITINGVDYYKELPAEPISTKITQSAIGKWVIVRSRNEGVNFGLVEEADETGIVLKDARRLWRVFTEKGEPAWYEGVSLVGLAESAMISVATSKKIIMEDYSITFCSEKAIEEIRNHEVTKTTYEEQ